MTSKRRGLRLVAAFVAVIVFRAIAVHAQASYAPPNEGPNPYQTVLNWAQLPDGRKWGSTAGVDIAPDGTVWAYDRCGANNCDKSPLAPVVHFDKTGRTIASFGAGMFVMPHGIFAGRDGHVWIADQLSVKDQKGAVVVEFSPDGRVLRTIGKAGVNVETHETFGAPTDVLVAPNGDIFVSDGHQGCNCASRIVKLSKDGRFIKEFGTKGSGPGELNMPHTLAMDSRGRLFVGDRTNNRVAIFNQDGTFITSWAQFGRPSGVFIDAHDMLYVADSESRDEDGYGHNPGVHRGIRIGSVKDGRVVAFIPDPSPSGGSSAAEGVAADPDGNVYGAEVGPRDFKKYVKK
jgi:NHL repeat-containing protein